MPTLDFKGKQFVYSHHHSVPFRELVIEDEKSLPEKNKKPSIDDNLIINGDNLHALKALMPLYAGKVKCIYIDPPYNTGNEGWCYNDNVNSPLMKEWLAKNANPVDREDLQRHDKWLCMMYPRLKLLHELLADDGVIFVSIDDNEVHHLRVIMDEIFGEENFLTQIVWKKRAGGGSDNKNFVSEFEYLVVYSRNNEVIEGFWQDYTDLESERFSEKDKKGEFYLKTLERPMGLGLRPNLQYTILAPDGSAIESRDDGKKYTWVVGKTRFAKMKEDGEIVFKQLKNEGWRVYRKVYKNQKTPRSLLTDIALNRDATSEQKDLLPEGNFNYPKPSKLIKYILSFATDKDSIILDSFAGSGTTAHAVLDLNKEDGGNRKFILVEMEDYANSITAQRVRRVINGVETAKDEKLKQGLGGSFTFCKLGDEFNIEKILTGEALPKYEALANYVFYTATGKTLGKSLEINSGGPAKQKIDYFVGETDLFEVYLIYQPDIAFLRSNESALNAKMVEIIGARESKKQKLVFASAKYMGQNELNDHKIIFCQLPYAIHKIAGK